jgi:hypothetical protein
VWSYVTNNTGDIYSLYSSNIKEWKERDADEIWYKVTWPITI